LKKSAIVISLLFAFYASSYSISFESNFLKASLFINTGKRIDAQLHLKRCIVAATNTSQFLKIASLYNQISPKNAKVYLYLQKAFSTISNAEESLITAKGYISYINNQGMARYSLNKGLAVSKSLKDVFEIARGFKKLLGDENCAADAINRGMVFAKSIKDLIKLSDVSYNEFDLIKCSNFALKKCWQLASSREHWLLIASAYKRIGITSKARLARGRAALSNW
jgi:hypothetical protein